MVTAAQFDFLGLGHEHDFALAGDGVDRAGCRQQGDEAGARQAVNYLLHGIHCSVIGMG